MILCKTWHAINYHVQGSGGLVVSGPQLKNHGDGPFSDQDHVSPKGHRYWLDKSKLQEHAIELK
jgi:hypothetical protein